MQALRGNIIIAISEGFDQKMRFQLSSFIVVLSKTM